MIENKQCYRLVIKCPIKKEKCSLDKCEFFRYNRRLSKSEIGILLSQDIPTNGIKRGEFCKAQDYLEVVKNILWDKTNIDGLNDYLYKNNFVIDKIYS